MKLPLRVYVCQECARPTLHETDRCCSGLVIVVEMVPKTPTTLQEPA